MNKDKMYVRDREKFRKAEKYTGKRRSVHIVGC